VLDGFDLGAGILHLFVARTNEERRAVLGAIGPVWDGNEVWLVASGGVLVFSFPRVYAAAFSGFYLPLMMVLWLLVLRGISIEFRSKVTDPLWRAFWDGTFAFASAVLAVVLGVALGNVLRGVPLDKTGYFAAPLFTNFRTGPSLGTVDWYTLLVGVLAWLVLAGHGALYLRWKTTGEVQRRCAVAARWLWPAVAVVGVSATAATAIVQPEILSMLISRPWTWVFPAWIVGSLAAVSVLSRGPRERDAFLASSSFIASMLVATAAGMWPVMLRSRIDPAFSLLATNSSSGGRGLWAGLAWWIPAIVLAGLYFVWLYRTFRGKVETGGHEDGHY